MSWGLSQIAVPTVPFVLYHCSSLFLHVCLPVFISLLSFFLSFLVVLQSSGCKERGLVALRLCFLYVCLFFVWHMREVVHSISIITIFLKKIKENRNRLHYGV